MRVVAIAGVFAAMLAGPSVSHAQEARELSVDQAVETAMSNNDEVKSSKVSVREKRASHRSATAKFGPSLRVESNVSRWDEPQTTEFSVPGQSGGGGPELTVREQTTANLSVTAVQPLSPLWSLYEAQRVEELSIEQAEKAHSQTRLDVQLDVVEAYLRLLQARAVRDVNEQSLERRKRQLERARKFREAEQVPKNDVLRAKVGVSRAEQQWVEAKGQVDLASAQLARTMGVSSGRPVVPTTEIEMDWSPPEDVDEAVERAVARRSAVDRAELRIDQARTGVRAAQSQLLPQVNALARYERSYGSTFTNEESFFIGANLQWTFWQWGTKSFEIDRARARKRRAELGRSRLVKGIELEVRNAYTNVETSRESLEVARRAVDQAEENYRAEKKRYEVQLSTSIDLLDAETQLTEMRTNARNAKYEYIIAAAELRRALGLSPWPGEASGSARAEREEP